MIIGWYEAGWWERHLNEDGVGCSRSEMTEAVEGYIGTDNMKLNEDNNTANLTTISGLVSIKCLFHSENKMMKNLRIRRKKL